MVSLLLISDDPFVAFFTAANDLVCNGEGLQPHRADVRSMESWTGADIQSRLDSRLRMDLCIMLLRIVSLIRSRSSLSQSISKGPLIVCLKPLFPSKTASGPVIPHAASSEACVADIAVFG